MKWKDRLVNNNSLPHPTYVKQCAELLNSFAKERMSALEQYEQLFEDHVWQEELKLISSHENLEFILKECSKKTVTFDNVQTSIPYYASSRDWMGLLIDALFTELKIIHIDDKQKNSVLKLQAYLQEDNLKKIIIIVPENQNLTLIINENNSLSNLFQSVTIIAQRNTRVNIVHTPCAPLASSYYNYMLHLFEDAQVCFGLTNGKSDYERMMIETFLHEQGGHCVIAGFYEIAHEQRSILLTNNVHRAGNSTSFVRLHGIVRDDAVALYRGLIDIENKNNGVLAEQYNKNMLLSKNARAISLPLLQVKTHQVKCAHGSAIGKLDDEQLFYLQARAINHKCAQQLLLCAFLRDSLTALNKEVGNELEKRVQDNVQTSFSHLSDK
ncbi:MAG: FeS cluster assembly protein SufD [Candidatus Dependentiae bacterium ADurb.Bin331]|nr:MAG: FeS cluster assembly protein SufD [Candidatus Dependentiae bacterium ADurb.Bin331]